MFQTFSTADMSPSAMSATPNRPLVRRRACDNCRNLKIKCLDTKPLSSNPAVCGSCQRAGQRCTYRVQPAKRGRPSKGDLRESRLTPPDTILDLDCGQSSETSTNRSSGQPVFDQNEQNALKDHPKYATEISIDMSSLLPDANSSTPSIAVPASIQDCVRLNVPRHNQANRDQVNVDSISRYNFQYTNRDIPLVGDALNAIDEFFDTVYITFPIVDYTSLITRLVMNPEWEKTAPDLRALLLAIRLATTCGQYRMNFQDRTTLCDLIFELETCRLFFDFADPPNLDTVVCSLALFTAYNVLEKHNRAFLYLDEALSLFETLPPSDSEGEKERRGRMEMVLFNTEAATFAIYDRWNRKRRARKPTTILDETPSKHQGVIGCGANQDRIATHLLRRLTKIHLAEDVDSLEKVNTELPHDFEVAVANHKFSRIQAADVDITGQWKLSSKFATGRDWRAFEANCFLVESLGIVVMSWICQLEEGELRIVGLGKVVDLLHNIHTFAGAARGHYILTGLLGAIIKEDYERNFQLQLSEIVASVLSSVPPTVEFYGPRCDTNGAVALASTCENENEISQPTAFHSQDVDWSFTVDSQDGSQMANMFLTDNLEEEALDLS